MGTMKEILDKFEGVEIDFEDEKYLITGPTEMVNQVYEEMIEAFREAEGEEEENKEEEEKKEDEDEDAEEKEEENEAKEDDEEEDDEEKDTEEGEDGETEEVKEKKVKPKVAAPMGDDEEEEKKDEEKRGKTDKKKMKRESDKSEDDVDDDIEDDIVIIEAEEVEGACKSKGQDDGDESQDKDETTEFSLDRLSLGRFTERINEFENNKLDEICEETSTEVKIEKGIFAIEEEEDEEEEEEGAEEQKGDDKKKEKRELQEKKKDKIQFTINGGTEEDRNSAEDLLSTHLSSVSDSRDEISQVLRREFGPKKAESWKQKVKNVANDDQIICQGICRDSVHLLHSSKAKSVTICQASFASFSVESAPYFRCDVTAVTPPKNWTDDVFTFFFKFASEENREILANLRQEMQYFYGNEENENKWRHVEDPREGDIIAVPGNMDDYWYRAVIVSKEEGEEDGGEEAEQKGDEEEKKKGEKETNGAEDETKGEKENEKKKEEDEEERAEEAFFWVRLLDYGAFAKVPQSNVMVLRKAKDFDFVTKVPFQAIFASFPRELVVKRAPEGEEEEEEKEEEKQNEKGKGEEKGDSPEKKEKQKEEKKGDEGKSEESRDDGRRGEDGEANEEEEEEEKECDEVLENTFGFLSHLVHSGSSHHIVGKLVGFWSVKSEVKAESTTESAVGSKAGFTAGSEADAEAGSEADAEDSFSAEESFKRKFRLFEDLGKLPVVELFDIGGWEEAEFKVSDVLVSQGMAEIKE